MRLIVETLRGVTKRSLFGTEKECSQTKLNWWVSHCVPVDHLNMGLLFWGRGDLKDGLSAG